jgi:hypothetical protein
LEVDINEKEKKEKDKAETIKQALGQHFNNQDKINWNRLSSICYDDSYSYSNK